MILLITLLFGSVTMLVIGTMEKIRASSLVPHMMPELEEHEFVEMKRLLSHFGNKMCVAGVFFAFIPVTKDTSIVAMLAAGWAGVFLSALISQGRINRMLKSKGISYRTMTDRIKRRRK